MNDYDLLKLHGHSPVKAAEITLDAKRGDEYALNWIAALRNQQGAYGEQDLARVRFRQRA